MRESVTEVGSTARRWVTDDDDDGVFVVQEAERDRDGSGAKAVVVPVQAADATRAARASLFRNAVMVHY